jgi:hypothetical protein
MLPKITILASPYVTITEVVLLVCMPVIGQRLMGAAKQFIAGL